MRSTAAVLAALAAVAGARTSRAQPKQEPAPPPPPAAAGAPIALSDALQVAVRQHPDLAEAAIDVRVADAQLLAAAGLDDWVLGATGSVSLTPQRSAFAMQERTTNLDLEVSLTKPLPTGGAIGIQGSTGWSNNPFTASSDGTYTHGVSLFASHSLLRGAGRDVARAQQARARSAREVAERARRAAAIVVIQNVVTSYWELAYAARSLEIRRGSQQLADERLRRIRAGISAGATAGIEEVAVSQIVATREEEVVLAEVDMVSRALALRRASGMPIGPGEVELQPTAPITIEPADMKFDALYTRALAANPEIALLEARVAGIEVDLRVAEDAMRPRLDAQVTAGLIGFAGKPGAAARDLAEEMRWSVVASLEYQQSLNNRGARGERDLARAERARIDVQLVDTRLRIAEALARAVALARAAARRAELAQKVVELAQQNIEAEKARERLGRATSFDVAEREEELAQAQLRQTRASIDYLSYATLVDALTGDILSRWGITIEDR